MSSYLNLSAAVWLYVADRQYQLLFIASERYHIWK